MFAKETTRNNAKVLRKNQTPWESKLWKQLRASRLGGLKFKRQTPIGTYIADFCCNERNLIVELDGGHHDDLENQLSDNERERFLKGQGYTVLRFWNNEIENNMSGVLEKINEIATSLPASPLDRGEG